MLLNWSKCVGNVLLSFANNGCNCLYIYDVFCVVFYIKQFIFSSNVFWNFQWFWDLNNNYFEEFLMFVHILLCLRFANVLVQKLRVGINLTPLQNLRFIKVIYFNLYLCILDFWIYVIFGMGVKPLEPQGTSDIVLNVLG